MTGGDAVRQVGLIGYPLRHSVSPSFQQAAFDEARLLIRYELWETPPDHVDELPQRLRRAETLGANVTIPYKRTILPMLDQVDPAALALGAVNTIVHRNGRLHGFNTDVVGIVEALRRDALTVLTDRRVVVIGAGGAARAVVAAALGEGAAVIVVCARRVESAEALVEDFCSYNPVAARSLASADFSADGWPRNEVIAAADIVVNATPVGMAHHANREEVSVDPTALHEGQLVFDLVYNPPETPLLRAARERNARTLGGLPMLVYQGAAAFELWTGQAAPVDLMRRVAREALDV